MTRDANLAPARHSRWRRMMAGQAGPVLVIVLVILALWHVMCVVMNAPVILSLAANPEAMSFADLVSAALSQERPILPAPHQILEEVWRSTLNVAVTSRRSLVYHGWVTLSATLLGFVMGVALGIALAVAIVHSRVLEKSLMPWIISSQTIPILAIAPIIIVVLGALDIKGLLPKSIISAYLCFFPVTIGMVKGLTSPDVLQLDLMRTYSASRAQLFFKLRWPAATPFLFASLKVAIAISLVGAIVGELPTGAEAGLGARMLSGSYYGQTVQIWAALVFAAAIASLLVALVGYSERLLLKKMGTQA